MPREGRKIAPDWLTLRIFLTAIEAGSLTRAAGERGIAVSAAAKRIQALEEECGCRLLERRARGVRPTAAGLALARHARSFLDLATRLTDDMRAFAAGGGGSVRLHATTSAIVGHGLGPVLARFAEARPGIAVEMREGTSAGVLRDLTEGRADLGVVTSGGAVPPGFEAHPWREDGATGNIASEELVLLCEEMGIPTGVDLEALIEVGRMAERIVGHPLPSTPLRSGSFNARRLAA